MQYAVRITLVFHSGNSSCFFANLVGPHDLPQLQQPKAGLEMHLSAITPLMRF